MSPRAVVSGLAAAVATLSALVLASGAFAAVGDLTQKPGTAGCISEDGTGGACVDGVALEGAASLATSPDGNSAYSTSSRAVAIFDRDPAAGALVQKSGSLGCISEGGTGGCAVGVALDGAVQVVVSPDGASAYVASQTSGAVAIFDRDPASGALAQKGGTAGCVSETGSDGACVDGVGLELAGSVTVSPDGRSAYVAANGSDAVAIFDRNPVTGALTQKPGTAGCVSDDGTGGACADGVGLNGAVSVTLSPDGKSAYVASRASSAVAIFDRDPVTGTLTQKPGTAGCVSEDGSGGACADGVGLWGVNSVTVSPDGKSAYVASDGNLVGPPHGGGVAIFDRDPATGALTQKPGTAGCVSEDGSMFGTAGLCADGVAVDVAHAVTVSPDGASAYVAAPWFSAVAIFDRDPATGALTQKPGTAGCVSEDGSIPGTAGVCADGVALSFPRTVAISADGANAYVPAVFSHAVAIFDRETAASTPPGGGAPPGTTPGTTPAMPSAADCDAAKGQLQKAKKALKQAKTKVKKAKKSGDRAKVKKAKKRVKRAKKNLRKAKQAVAESCAAR